MVERRKAAAPKGGAALQTGYADGVNLSARCGRLRPCVSRRSISFFFGEAKKAKSDSEATTALLSC